MSYWPSGRHVPGVRHFGYVSYPVHRPSPVPTEHKSSLVGNGRCWSRFCRQPDRQRAARVRGAADRAARRSRLPGQHRAGNPTEVTNGPDFATAATFPAPVLTPLAFWFVGPDPGPKPYAMEAIVTADVEAWHSCTQRLRRRSSPRCAPVGGRPAESLPHLFEVKSDWVAPLHRIIEFPLPDTTRPDPPISTTRSLQAPPRWLARATRSAFRPVPKPRTRHDQI